MPAASSVRRNALFRLDLDPPCGTPVAKVLPTFVCREAGPTSPCILERSNRSAVLSAARRRARGRSQVRRRSVIDLRERLERIEAAADLIEQCVREWEPRQVRSP